MSVCRDEVRDMKAAGMCTHPCMPVPQEFVVLRYVYVYVCAYVYAYVYVCRDEVSDMKAEEVLTHPCMHVPQEFVGLGWCACVFICT